MTFKSGPSGTRSTTVFHLATTFPNMWTWTGSSRPMGHAIRPAISSICALVWVLVRILTRIWLVTRLNCAVVSRTWSPLLKNLRLAHTWRCVYPVLALISSLVLLLLLPSAFCSYNLLKLLKLFQYCNEKAFRKEEDKTRTRQGPPIVKINNK